VCLHAAVTALLVIAVRLYRLLPGEPRMASGSSRAEDLARGAANGGEVWGLAATGLVFGLHPIHCEAVTGLVGRADVLASLLVVLALLVYYPAAVLSRGAPGWRDCFLGLLSLLAACALIVCATLCKETGLTGLAVLALMDAQLNKINALPLPLPTHADTCALHDADPASFKGDGDRDGDGDGEPCSDAPGKSDSGGDDVGEGAEAVRDESMAGAGCGAPRASADDRPSRIAWGFTVRLSLLAAAGALILRQRLSLQAGGQPAFTAHNNPAAFAADAPSRYRTYWHYYALNLQLLVWPYPLCCDWSMGAVPLVDSWQDPRNLGSLAVLVLLLLWVGVAISACRQHWASAPHRVAAVGGGIMLVAFLPASNALFAVGFSVAERVLYMPSIGASLLFAGLFAPVLPLASLRWVSHFGMYM
jgi:hypothetical protein